MVVGKMDLIIPRYSATEIQEREKALSCKRPHDCWESNKDIADRLG